LDPRAYALCAFGGAGGLHACELAEELGMDMVVVPAHAGVLSAVGMMQGRAASTRSQTVLNAVTRMAEVRAELERAASDALGEEVETITSEVSARYRGQSFELLVPYDGEWGGSVSAFEDAHDRRFGYQLEAEVEPVTLHVRAQGMAPEEWHPVERSSAGTLVGPAHLVRKATTIYVASGWRAEVAADGDVELRRL
jgi:N-methylhydantoinase A